MVILSYQEQLGESIPFQLRSPDAILPEKATSGSIGYDVHSTTTIIVHPKSIIRVPTGLACAIPDGMYIKLHNHSSNALRLLTVEGGVIDNDYRGEIDVLLKKNLIKLSSSASMRRLHK